MGRPGLVPWLVGSPQTVDGTHVPCVGRWRMSRRTTRGALASAREDAAKTCVCLRTFLVVLGINFWSRVASLGACRPSPSAPQKQPCSRCGTKEAVVWWLAVVLGHVLPQFICTSVQEHSSPGATPVPRPHTGRWRPALAACVGAWAPLAEQQP